MDYIYLDHAATTPVHPAVVDAMMPYWSLQFGNPSSMHAFGRAAQSAVSAARETIADYVACAPGQLIFTSGGTESNNTAIFGAVFSAGERKKHIITSQIEHHAVLHPCRHLEQLGYEVTYLPADSTGRLHVDEVLAAIRPETGLISIMYGNNEVGTLQPVDEIGSIARERSILFHVDAVQALAKVPIQLDTLPVDLMSFSAHKINGPKGVGALYAAKHVRLLPFQHGGSQERKRRAGTENVPGIVGFAAAVQVHKDVINNRKPNSLSVRSKMIAELRKHLGDDGFTINGNEHETLPHILNVSFPGASSETMLMSLDMAGIAASSGSACTSGSLEVSHVLKAMRLPEPQLQSAVRFSFGGDESDETVQTAALKIATCAKAIRNRSY